VFGLRLQDAGGDYVVAAALEDYLREWLGRRAVKDCAVGGGEYAAVAGASEDVGLGAVKHRARVMGAEAAEGEVGFLGGAEQEAGAVVRWISENSKAAHWDFVGLGDYFCWVSGFVFLPIHDEGACCGERAGCAAPYVEAAACDWWSFFSL